ncbi:MAG: hypothetical protein ACP5P4_05275 [Steroidobacteraceae bacterium]
MIIAILILVLIWLATAVTTVEWANHEYERGYEDGYADADDWAQQQQRTRMFYRTDKSDSYGG